MPVLTYLYDWLSDQAQYVSTSSTLFDFSTQAYQHSDRPIKPATFSPVFEAAKIHITVPVSVTAMAPADTYFPFLRLPFEIRCEIYELVVVDCRRTLFRSKDTRRQICFTNRQVYHEANQIFYFKNEFIIPGYSPIRNKEACRLFRHINVMHYPFLRTVTYDYHPGRSTYATKHERSLMNYLARFPNFNLTITYDTIGPGMVVGTDYGATDFGSAVFDNMHGFIRVTAETLPSLGDTKGLCEHHASAITKHLYNAPVQAKVDQVKQSLELGLRRMVEPCPSRCLIHKRRVRDAAKATLHLKHHGGKCFICTY